MKLLPLMIVALTCFSIQAQEIPNELQAFPFEIEKETVQSPSREDFSWEVLYGWIDNSSYTLSILERIEQTADNGLEAAAKIDDDHVYRYAYENEGVEGLIFVNERTLAIEITCRKFGIIGR